MDKAGRIAYFAWTNFFEDAETFNQARTHTIAAARILYGTCSNELLQTCRAWAAVNVGPVCEPCIVVNPNTRNCGKCGTAEKRDLTSIEEISLTSHDVRVYPNPTTNLLNIEFNTSALELDANERVSIILTDLTGKQINVKEFNIIGNTEYSTILNIKSLPSGIYLLKISGKNFLKTTKVIKQ